MVYSLRMASGNLDSEWRKSAVEAEIFHLVVKKNDRGPQLSSECYSIILKKSLSVNMPTSAPFLTTGTAPMSFSLMIFAA